MAKFNYRELYRAVATSEIGAKRVNTVMQRKFAENKALMMKEFEQHPVTQELKGGIEANNDSGTLDGEGNLYSFIGFEAGTDPVEPVRAVLETQTTLVASKRAQPDNNKVSYKFSLRLPSEAIKTASPIPWEGGKSWVEGIERGISGFSNYIAGRFRSPKPSRSGGGRQAEEPVRQATFKKRGYMTEIIAAFLSNFK